MPGIHSLQMSYDNRLLNKRYSEEMGFFMKVKSKNNRTTLYYAKIIMH